MNRFMFSLSGMAISSLMVLSPSPAFAQHLHQHGGHYDVHQNVQHGHDAAGHLTDSRGHHINGDGQHTGSTGVYENGSYSVPRTYHYPYQSSYPTYVTPSVATSTYYPSVSSSTPTVVVSSPPPARVVSNKVPIASPSNPIPGRSTSGGTVKLSNPLESGGSLSYSLNQHPYSIKPGESQTIKLTKEWTIKFDNGLSREVVYRLEDGQYKFTVNPQSGWDLAKIEEEIPSAPVTMDGPPPSLVGNTIPGQL